MLRFLKINTNIILCIMLHWLDVPSYDGDIYDPTQVQGCQKWHR